MVTVRIGGELVQVRPQMTTGQRSVIRSRCPCRWKFAICSMPEQVPESGDLDPRTMPQGIATG